MRAIGVQVAQVSPQEAEVRFWAESRHLPMSDIGGGFNRSMPTH